MHKTKRIFYNIWNSLLKNSETCRSRFWSTFRIFNKTYIERSSNS